MRPYLIATLCFLFSSGIFCQTITIYSDAPEYVNTEVIFYKNSDEITETEEIIGSGIISDNGIFKIQFSCTETTFIYSYLGIFKVHLYAEPGKEYNIILPPRMDKTDEDKLNPYFSYTRIHLGTKEMDENELNFLIRVFNDQYIPYYNKHVVDVFSQKDVTILEKDIDIIEKKFKDYDNKYFKDYREYRYALLKQIAYKNNLQTLSDNYFINKPILYNNIAYMDLFNQVFEKFLLLYSRSEEGKDLITNVNDQKDFTAAVNTLKKNKYFVNDNFIELVILKCFYEEFYNNIFSRSAMLQIIDTLITKTEIPEHIIIGNKIRTKVTKLLAGYTPPQFNLYDTDSNLVSLESFKGKYVYLNFCSCFSYTCLNEFEMLSGIYERHKDKLEIITIITDEPGTVLQDFLSKNKYNWRFLHYSNQPDIIKKYDIRAYPTYYLIDKEGKLIYSPSPAPSEDFEGKLFNVLKAKGDL